MKYQLRKRYQPTQTKVKKVSSVRKVLFFLLIGTGVSVLLLIVAAIRTSSKGAQLTAIETQTKEIEAQNNQIKEKIIEGTSLTKLSESIDTSSYHKELNYVYLNKDMAVAQLP